LDGQKNIWDASVATIGCGAIGSAAAELLARAGVGRLKVVDRDLVELSNLHRQLLYDERHAVEGLPKVVACAERLRQINSDVEVEPVVDDVNPRNVEAIISDVDIIVDGTDNFETRFILNDAALKLGKPWIYGAALETYGVVMPIVPDRSPCLRDLVPSPPPPGSLPTCEAVGVLNAVTVAVASLQVTESLKILTGRIDDAGKAVYIDLWNSSFEVMKIERREDCPACVLGKYEFLEGRFTRDLVLCGRNAVQISPRVEVELNLEELAGRLEKTVSVRLRQQVLYIKVDGYEIAVFRNGRAIVKGTSDPALAKSLYSRYVGL